jgi:hypothetical protein
MTSRRPVDVALWATRPAHLVDTPSVYADPGAESAADRILCESNIVGARLDLGRVIADPQVGCREMLTLTHWRERSFHGDPVRDCRIRGYDEVDDSHDSG